MRRPVFACGLPGLLARPACPARRGLDRPVLAITAITDAGWVLGTVVALGSRIEKDGLALDLITMIATLGMPHPAGPAHRKLPVADDASESLLRGLAAH